MYANTMDFRLKDDIIRQRILDDSYPERRRDWPYEARQPALTGVVPTPATERLGDKRDWQRPFSS